MGFIDQVKAVWPLIMQAPWGFAPVAVALLFAGWAAGRFMFNERIATLKSRIEKRDETISELRGASPEVDGNNQSARNILLGRLTAQYMASHDGLSPRMLAGLESPPVEWINAELEKLGEDWRVRNANGKNRDI